MPRPLIRSAVLGGSNMYKHKDNNKGRPRKFINPKEFENLCAMQCTETEICAFFGVSDRWMLDWCKRTYNKTFFEVFREKREAGHISLRRSQFKLAEKNPTMSIWLGKQYLGQRDYSVSNDSERQVEDLNAVLDEAGLNGINTSEED